MTLSLIAIAIMTTIMGVAVHIIWWRIRRPVDDAFALAVIVGFVPLAFSVIYTLVSPYSGRPPFFSWEYLCLLAALSVLHGLLALVYMSCYTAAQAASPTVLIVLSASNSDLGLTRQNLEDRLTDDLVCGDLVHAAIHEKFVDMENGGLRIGARGRWLLAMGRTVRKLAGLSAPVG